MFHNIGYRPERKPAAKDQTPGKNPSIELVPLTLFLLI
jgi:hypothetical protein